MIFLDSVLNEPIFYSLSITLLHFLWQGILISVGLFLFLKLVDHKRSTLRYTGCLAAMSLCVLLPTLTFLLVHQPLIEVPSDFTAMLTTITALNMETAFGSSANGLLELIPLLSIAWMLGVSFFSIHLLLEMFNVYQLARSSTVQPDPQMQMKFKQLAARLKINKAARLIISAKAEVPMVIGWLKPVVLVPLSMYSGLSSRQLEMLLAHELAHIKRNDYLINFLQTLVEVVFFFHPCVKWISKQVREEREYCCDDIAIHHCGNAVAYATALTDAEMLRPHNIPQLAMAASGGNLKRRIYRAVGQQNCSPNFTVQWLASLFSFVLISSILTASQVIGLPEDNVEASKVIPEELETANSMAKPKVTLPKLEIKDKNLAANLNRKKTAIEISLAVEDAEMDIIQKTRVEPKSLTKKVSIKKPAVAGKSTTAVAPNKNKFSKQVTQANTDIHLEVTNQSPVDKNNINNKRKLKNKENNRNLNMASLDSKPSSIKSNQLKSDQVVIEQKFKPIIVYPKLIKASLPYYPSIANKKKLSAEVKVSFDVSKKGQVRNIIFHGDVHSSFKRSIKSVLKKWQYEPGTLDGKLASMKITKVFDFTRPSGLRKTFPPQVGSRIKRG